MVQWQSFGSAFCGRWFDLQLRRSWYTLLIRPNKVETAVQWFRMSHAVRTGFSGHCNSIYIYMCVCVCVYSEKFIWWRQIYEWWFKKLGSKHYNTDGSSVWTAKEAILKNKSHLVTLHESILGNLFFAKLIYTLIYIYIYIYIES